MKNKIFIIFTLLFLIQIINAADLCYTDCKLHEKNIDKYVSFTDSEAGQCNITTIEYPTGNTSNLNIVLTGDAHLGLIDSGNFTQLGIHKWNYLCANGYGCDCVEVTNTGSKINSVQVSIYILFLLSCLFLLILSGWLIKSNPFSKDTLTNQKRYDLKKRNNFLFYMSILKKKLWILGVFGIYISLILFLAVLNQLFYALDINDISNMLLNINIVLLWGLIPFTIFWIGYIILFLFKTAEDMIRYQYGRWNEK